MILTLTRGQGSKGMMSKNVTFKITAKIDLTEEERFSVDKYKLGNESVYNSETARKHLDGFSAAGSAVGALAKAAMAKMSLQLTINNLTQGKTVECATLDEAISAEEAIQEACGNVKTYIAVAQSFDGSAEKFEF